MEIDEKFEYLKRKMRVTEKQQSSAVTLVATRMQHVYRSMVGESRFTWLHTGQMSSS